MVAQTRQVAEGGGAEEETRPSILPPEDDPLLERGTVWGSKQDTPAARGVALKKWLTVLAQRQQQPQEEAAEESESNGQAEKSSESDLTLLWRETAARVARYRELEKVRSACPP